MHNYRFKQNTWFNINSYYARGWDTREVPESGRINCRYLFNVYLRLENKWFTQQCDLHVDFMDAGFNQGDKLSLSNNSSDLDQLSASFDDQIT